MPLKKRSLPSPQTIWVKKKLKSIDSASMNNFFTQKKSFDKQTTTNVSTVESIITFTKSKTAIENFAEKIKEPQQMEEFIKAINLQAKSMGTNKTGLFYRLIYGIVKKLKNKEQIKAFFEDENQTNQLLKNIKLFLLAKNDKEIVEDPQEKGPKLTQDDVRGINRTKKTNAIQKLQSTRLSNVLKVFMALVLWEYMINNSEAAQEHEQPPLPTPPATPPRTAPKPNPAPPATPPRTAPNPNPTPPATPLRTTPKPNPAPPLTPPRTAPNPNPTPPVTPPKPVPKKITPNGILLHGPGAITGKIKKEDLHYNAIAEKATVQKQFFNENEKRYKNVQVFTESGQSVKVDTIDFSEKMQLPFLRDLYDPQKQHKVVEIVNKNTSAPTLEREVNIDGCNTKKCAGKIGFSESIIQQIPTKYTGEGKSYIPGQNIISLFEKVYPRPKGYELYQIVQAASQTNGLESVGNFYSSLTDQHYDATQGPTACSISAMAWMRRDIMYRNGELPDSAAELLDALENEGIIEENQDGYVPCARYAQYNPAEYFYKCGYIHPWALNQEGQKRLLQQIALHPCGYMSQAAVTDEEVESKDNSKKQRSFRYAFGGAMSYQGVLEEPADDELSKKLNMAWMSSQYENIIKDAIRASDSLPENTVILVHLTAVGQGAFKNPRGIPDIALNSAMRKFEQQLYGSNIRIITHWAHRYNPYGRSMQ